MNSFNSLISTDLLTGSMADIPEDPHARPDGHFYEDKRSPLDRAGPWNGDD